MNNARLKAFQCRRMLLGAGLLLVAQSVAASQAVAPAAGGPESNGVRNEIYVMVSVPERKLWVMAGKDTLHMAPIAVPSGEILEYGGRRWQFSPPAGARIVRGKKTDPVWSPPDWHYIEVARSLGLPVKPIATTGTRLQDGRKLVVRDSLVGLVSNDDTTFSMLPVDEHIIFDSTLFIPPLATHNRQVPGELGKFALDLGNGYLLHGTRNTGSIGTASTHGCIRLDDFDIEWIFDHVPLGARVYVR